jgi:hypothetical protein
VVNAEPGEPWLIWCHLNDEAERITQLIPGAVNVQGSDSPESKSKNLLGFAHGEIRVLVSKPKIAGFGMNWQHCARMAFVGLDDSFEKFYQAVRRCYRFGQKREVQVHLFTAENEGQILANLKRKEVQHHDMSANMIEHMKEIMNHELTGWPTGRSWRAARPATCATSSGIRAERTAAQRPSPPPMPCSPKTTGFM